MREDHFNLRWLCKLFSLTAISLVLNIALNRWSEGVRLREFLRLLPSKVYYLEAGQRRYENLEEDALIIAFVLKLECAHI